MTKTQKIWLWIFIAMFALPEILFSVILSSIVNYSGKEFLTLFSAFFDNRFFINNPIIFFIVLLLEIIGLTGLLWISLKSKKKIISGVILIVLIWLLFILFLAYTANSISLVM